MTNYGQHFSTLKTPQSEPARADQVQNDAGGFTFEVDKWSKLDRWLILGAEGGTFYAGEKELTISSAKAVIECLKEDGARTVARIVDVSDRGLAPKNDAAIFALAVAAGDDSPATRAAALAALPKVCRTGTHLFHFVQAVSGFRRWGRGLRRAVAAWYTAKSPRALANQLVKYRQRDGWSHKDLMRLAHPKATTSEQETLFRYAIAGKDGLGVRSVVRGKPKDPSSRMVFEYNAVGELPTLVEAFEEAQVTKDKQRLCRLIMEHGLTHEMLPTEWKRDRDVWSALLVGMPPTALLRNLGKMTQVGLLAPMSTMAGVAATRLMDKEALKGARVHPMSVLVALRIYQQGHGEKGKLHWSPVRDVVDALDEAFYLAFDAVEPTGKATLLGLDISGSMASPVTGLPLTCREASAAMAMVTARTEKRWHVFGFTAASGGTGGRWGGGTPGFTEIPISPRQRLDDVVKMIQHLPMGGTDCSLPMLYAIEKKLDVDVFQVYTDNETWAGQIHPHQALAMYRRQRNPKAKLVTLAMALSNFTIADPRDAGMLDIAGLSADVPQVIASFTRE